MPREVTRGKQLIRVLLVHFSCLPGYICCALLELTFPFPCDSLGSAPQGPQALFFYFKTPSCLVSLSGISCWGCSWHRAWGKTLGRSWHPQCRCHQVCAELLLLPETFSRPFCLLREQPLASPRISGSLGASLMIFITLIFFRSLASSCIHTLTS